MPYRPHEFGELIGKSVSTLRRWDREGKLVPQRGLGNQRYYTEDDLKKALKLETGNIMSGERLIIKTAGSRGQGAGNAKKYFKRLARTHGRISNVRNDFLQKSSTELATCHSVIRLEDLNVKGMMQFGKLSSAITDQGFGEFRRQLVYKASWAGGRVELVDRFYPSSKKCSSCGFVKPKLKLSERVYHCENCGHVQDRDENAAWNLCYAPIEKIRLAQPEQSDT